MIANLQSLQPSHIDAVVWGGKSSKKFISPHWAVLVEREHGEETGGHKKNPWELGLEASSPGLQSDDFSPKSTASPLLFRS